MSLVGAHLLERASSGGVLLDTGSGNLYSLNETATRIWEKRLSGQSLEAIAAELSAAHGLPAAVAAQHVSSALALVPTGLAVPTDPDGYVYERAEEGYVFSRYGAPVLSIKGRNWTIRLELANASEQAVLGALWSISPKLLALALVENGLVLHASAVVTNGAVLAFTGESGAGKTTTAMVLARAGAELFCEDKLLVRLSDGRPEAMVGLEMEIRRWISTTTSALLRHEAVELMAWTDRLSAPWLPVQEIGLISAARRRGAEIVGRRLAPADTASLLFCSSFQGSEDHRRWQHQLKAATELSERASVLELTMPAGLAALESAAPAFLNGHRLRSR
jgi:hypothetical protein